MLNFFEDIQNSESQLYKDFTFEEEHIIIPLTTILNDEVVIPLQNENIVVPYKVQIQFILLMR